VREIEKERERERGRKREGDTVGVEGDRETNTIS